MKELPKISDAEWKVMKVLWSKSPIPSNDVIQTLENHTDWSPKTIRTLINRLVQKEAIGVNTEGKVYTYFPIVQEDELIKVENQSFLKRIYGGALQPMLVNFLKEEKLSNEEIEELKRILDERKG